jgi:hypothetical protein
VPKSFARFRVAGTFRLGSSRSPPGLQDPRKRKDGAGGGVGRYWAAWEGGPRRINKEPSCGRAIVGQRIAGSAVWGRGRGEEATSLREIEIRSTWTAASPRVPLSFSGSSATWPRKSRGSPLRPRLISRYRQRKFLHRGTFPFRKAFKCRTNAKSRGP